MVPDHSSFILFLGAALVLLAIPGPAVFYVGLLFAAMGIVSDSLWGLFAGTVADRLRANNRWSRRQRYISGGMLISLGLATAVSGHAPQK